MTKLTNRKHKHRSRLFEEQGGKCCFCERTMLLMVGENVGGNLRATLEHINPKANGGRWALQDLALSCRRCNTIRGVIPFDVFKEERLWEGKQTIRRIQLQKQYHLELLGSLN